LLFRDRGIAGAEMLLALWRSKPRVEGAAEPLHPGAVLLVLRFLMISRRSRIPHAAAILRRTGACAVSTARVPLWRDPDPGFFDDDLMGPAVAEIVRVAEAAPRPGGDVEEGGRVLVQGPDLSSYSSRSKLGRSSAFAHHELMQVAIAPPIAPE